MNLAASIEEILKGRGDVDQLLSQIELSRADLRSLERDFEATYQREGEAVRAWVEAEVEAVRRSLSAYFDLLESCAAYAQGFDRVYLEAAGADLEAAQTRLELDFARFRRAAWSGRGPTSHAGLNELYWLLEQPVPLLEEFLQNQQLEPGNEFEHRYQELLDLISVEFDPIAAQQQIAELGQVYARIDLEGVTRRYWGGPTAWPEINLVLHSGWLLGQDQIEVEVFRTLLERAQEKFSETPLQEALERCWVWLEEGDAEDFLALAESLQKLARELSTPGFSLSENDGLTHSGSPRLENLLTLAQAILMDPDHLPEFSQALASLQADLLQARQAGGSADYQSGLQALELGLECLQAHGQNPDRSLVEQAELQLERASRALALSLG